MSSVCQMWVKKGKAGPVESLEDASVDFEDLETVFCGLLLGGPPLVSRNSVKVMSEVF